MRLDEPSTITGTAIRCGARHMTSLWAMSTAAVRSSPSAPEATREISWRRSWPTTGILRIKTVW